MTTRRVSRLTVEELESRTLPAGAHVTGVVFSGATSGTFDRVRLTFSEPILTASFTSDDIGRARPQPH